MIVYLIKSSLCMLLLWGFYILFLERENMHFTKRFFLIFSLIFSLTIPLITFTYQTDVVLEPIVTEHPITTMVLSNDVPVIVTPSIDYLSIVLWCIYAIGVLVFGFRFIKNLKNLTKKITGHERLKEPSHINVLVSDIIVPHTFLKYIFVSKKAYQEKSIPEEVLLHEKTHVLQKHTLDILFIEILQVIFWFNPLLILIKKSIKLNHEFLADQTVLKRQFSLQEYMNLLVTYPNSSNQTELSSPINYSLTKKRIIMMSQQFSKTRAAARLLLLLPILLICTLLFNNEIIAQQKNVNYTKTVQDPNPDKKIEVKVNGTQITVNGTATNLSGFAKTIDDYTKKWKDKELTDFNFDVQITNADDGFVEKINNVYQKTRLYKANPGDHELIPPPPPLPSKTRMVKTPKPPKVRKGDKSSIPPPPAPKAPLPSSFSQVEDEQIAYEEAIAMEAAEKAMHEVEAQYEHEIESAMHMAEAAREAAAEAREHAIEQAEHARGRAGEARRRAMEAAHEARARAREVAHRAQERAHREYKRTHKAREEAMRHAHLAREQVEKARAIARKEAYKVRRRTLHGKHSKKEQLEAQQKAIKAELKAVKKRLKEEKRASRKN